MWIAISTGASVFLFVLAAFGGASRKMGRQTSEEWLFSRFFEKIYDAFFSQSDPKEKTAKLGMSYDKYIRNCRILRIEPNWKREAGMRMMGIAVFLLSLFLSVLLKMSRPHFWGLPYFSAWGHIRNSSLANRQKCAGRSWRRICPVSLIYLLRR